MLKGTTGGAKALSKAIREAATEQEEFATSCSSPNPKAWELANRLRKLETLVAQQSRIGISEILEGRFWQALAALRAGDVDAYRLHAFEAWFLIKEETRA